MLLDPPEGWKYGFPKQCPTELKDLNAWLVEQGYPQKLIDSYGEHFYVRFIGETIEIK